MTYVFNKSNMSSYFSTLFYSPHAKDNEFSAPGLMFAYIFSVSLYDLCSALLYGKLHKERMRKYNTHHDTIKNF